MGGYREGYGRGTGMFWEGYGRGMGGVCKGMGGIEGVWDGYKRGGLEYGRVLEG